MTPAEFAESISDFGRLNTTEQVKRFSWYLCFYAKRGGFTGSDVGSCFESARYPKPSSIAPFLASLTRQKPPFLLRQSGGYTLSRHAHIMFDGVLGQREATIAVDKLLQKLTSQLPIHCERAYLEEAIICFRHGAFRAAVVMAWNVAYDHLCTVILQRALPDFNLQLPKSFPKADIQQISARGDFESLKESQVLQVAKSANVISGSLHKVLKEKLDRRNIAAHPSGVAISRLTAEEFITDLIQNVVLRFN